MSLEKELEDSLVQRAGPLLTGDLLISSLGYASKDAFRKALQRGTLPVVVFEIPKRRGKFALTRDVAKWLALQKESALSKSEESQ